jgi:hypothetical protein
MAGDTLNITCNFLYCNHQVHRNFLITLYKLYVKCSSYRTENTARACYEAQSVLYKETISFIVDHKTQMNTLCGKVQGFLLL